MKIVKLRTRKLGRRPVLCLQSPAEGPHTNWICGRDAGHTGLHVDIGERGAWNQEVTA